MYQKQFKKELDKTFPNIKIITTGKGGSRPFNFFYLEDYIKKLHPDGDYKFEKMAFIGDRLFDDVVYANNNKMVSI